MERGELARRLGAAAGSRTGGPRAVEERDTARFMRSFADAVSAGGDIFLADPAWRSTERAEFAQLMKAGASGDRGWLMVPSGGAGGVLKFARHDGWTIAAAVGGFCRHFGMERVNSISVLPLHHVSGLMAWMRSALTGGSFAPLSWADVGAGRLPPEPPADCCVSLVPTQLQRLLASKEAVAWLRKMRVIFLGGAPAWDALVEDGARLGLPLSPCYGSTETAAMVTALKPEQFLGGWRGCGTPLPHANVDFVDGVIRVAGESVFRGFFPGIQEECSWLSGDLGSFDSNGSLVVHGRLDDLIITGGKKVSPAEVESALRLAGEFEDVAVIGLPDPEWGQVVVACHPPLSHGLRSGRLDAALSRLAPFKHPKRYTSIAPWPRNPQGKVDRAELARLASGA